MTTNPTTSGTKPRLIYFDNPASRGEECRLALVIAGVDFEDVRIPRGAWAALKPTTPYGALPVFEEAGHRPLAQSNAILALIGRRYGLHPKDEFESARHESVMMHVEDLRAAVGPSGRLTDEAEKKKAREALATGYIPTWAANVERQIADDGPFFAGAVPHVADVKLHMAVRLLAGGKLDYVPATVVAAFPKLNRVHDAVRDHQAVKAWYARSA
jgi:glutathione S-transferase